MHEWDSKLYVENRGFIGNTVLLAKISSAISEAGENLHVQFRSVRASVSGLQWNRDTGASLRSETNGVAERAVRRVKEGTSVARVQSGPLGGWWDCAMEGYCYLDNVLDTNG